MALHTLTQKELLLKVRQFIPPLLEHFHKGQQGRVAVVGGCEDYTGAPYFSAYASALLGCDMSHVICDPHASPTIKSYSPNLMVHPYMRSLASSTTFQPNPTTAPTQSQIDNEVHLALSRILPLLPRLHVLVIGPGLGRDPIMQTTVARIITAARERNLSIVLDADAIMAVQANPEIVRGYHDAILTPNHAEFGRLCVSLGIDPNSPTTASNTNSTTASAPPTTAGLEEEDKGALCAQVARALGGVTVLQKGPQDWISNGTTTLTCTVRGGLKRSGGQGDTLTGCIGTLLAWKKAYLDGLWENDKSIQSADLTLLSAFGASAITRLCSRRAFEKKGRSLQASDLSGEVTGAFKDLFEVEESALEAKL